MSLSMSIEYPTFTYNNESVIIKPGNQFTNKQLRSRLHQMDVDAINIDSKAQLVNLYESTLKDDRNKFKLFDRLKKDTEDYYLKTGINLNRTMPMPPRNESINNPERSKVIGLKYEKQKEYRSLDTRACCGLRAVHGSVHQPEAESRSGHEGLHAGGSGQ